jgi:broad specificity phosphatase PhoE
MRYLILVRHSLPNVVPNTPGRFWQLSAEGRARCRFLAAQLAGYQPASIVASMEPKATETAALLSTYLHLPYEAIEGLHEHERDNVPYLGKVKWEETISAFFARPDELVFGSETATQALQRFTGAVQKVLQQHTEGNIVIVTHGTVITLFTAHHANIQPFPFWLSLDTPAFSVWSLPSYGLLRTVARLEMPSQ